MHHNPGSLPDINDYRSVVWTDKKRSIPSVIIVYAAPTFCKTTVDPNEGEIVPLTVMSAFNTGDGPCETMLSLKRLTENAYK